MKRIKVFTFNFKEFKPTKEGLYLYDGEKYTNRTFMNFLRQSQIWFNTFYENVESRE